MKHDNGKFAFRSTVGLVLLMAVVFSSGKQTAAAFGIIELQKKAIVPPKYQTEDSYKIIEVLEKKMDGKKLSHKAREKLFTLPQDQTHLIISLCERISPDEHSAGADFAYLLVVALILVS
jgi:hypothetical protein